MEPKELSDFDKGQVVVARELGLSVSQTAKMVGCSRAAVVSAYRQWYEEGLRLRAGRPKLIDPKELDDESGSESDEAAAEEEEEEEETQSRKPRQMSGLGMERGRGRRQLTGPRRRRSMEVLLDPAVTYRTEGLDLLEDVL